jgi:hypothetical protein
MVNKNSVGRVLVQGLRGWLPGRFANAGDEPIAGKFAEADSAHTELAIHSAGTAADLAAAGEANLLAGLDELLLVSLVRGLLHLGSVSVERREHIAVLGFFRVC